MTRRRAGRTITLASLSDLHAGSLVIQQGAWQLKSAHAHKVAAMELSDLGGVIIQAQAGRRPDVEAIIYPPSPSSPKVHQ